LLGALALRGECQAGLSQPDGCDSGSLKKITAGKLHQLNTPIELTKDTA
jgi:hypothetical protein